MAGEVGSEGNPLNDELEINGIGPVKNGEILAGVFEPGYFNISHKGRRARDIRGSLGNQPFSTTLAPSGKKEGMNIGDQPGVEVIVTYENGKSKIVLQPVGLGFKGAYQLDLEQRRLVKIPVARGTVEISGHLLAFPIVNEGVGLVPVSWLVDEGKKATVKKILGPVFGSLVVMKNEAVSAAVGLAGR